MPSRKTTSKALRIGHISITLLPGESARRVNEISRQVREQWQPASIVEEFDCDTIIHAIFKLERYQRFFNQLVKSGIRAEDIRGAEATYQAAIRAAERNLLMARESGTRKPPQRATSAEHDLASMPVHSRVQ